MKRTLLLVLALAAGCSSSPDRIVQGTKYPTTAKHLASIDIQVFRRETEVEFTNTTARAFGPSTLWLNARFSHAIDGLAVGQSMRIPLKQFKDEFGDSFRGGGFFATERPDRLGLAEIQTGNEIVGLVVVGGDEL